MAVKEILMPCDCTIGLPNGTSIGLNLAGDLDASITGLGLVPQYPILEYFTPPPDMPAVPQAVIDRHKKELEESRSRATRTEGYLSELAEMQDVPSHWQQTEDTPEQLGLAAGKTARAYDLVIIDQAPDGSSKTWANVVDQVILHGGRPVIVVPPDLTGTGMGDHAIIGWNDSSEAARAAHDAISLLLLRDEACVVSVNNGEDGATPRNAAKLAAHLKKHGVVTTAQEIDSDGKPVEDVLLEYTVEKNADLLVIGGYGKARWRETMFGSLTRNLLFKSPIPVLVSH